MWLGHFIEHLMCIGGEVEHHKALPSPAREKQSTGVLCSRARGIYRHLISPSSSHQPGPMVVGQERGPLVPVHLDLLVPVGGLNRDQRLPFSPGSCHQPEPMRCLYIPLAREQSTPVLCFSLAEGERALWCSSSPPMHMRCSMECPSHTT